jgi:hypothetical protein
MVFKVDAAPLDAGADAVLVVVVAGVVDAPPPADAGVAPPQAAASSATAVTVVPRPKVRREIPRDMTFLLNAANRSPIRVRSTHVRYVRVGCTDLGTA